MWLFGRRKAAKVKRPPSVAGADRPVAAVHAFANNDVLRSPPSRRSSRRRRRTSSPHSTASVRDVEKDPPTLDADPALAKKQGNPRSSAEALTALPNLRPLAQSPHLRSVSQHSGIPYNFQQPNSQASLPPQPEDRRSRLHRSLSSRKTANEAPVRRKSSKKQKREQDQLREEEIRAMSIPITKKRPAGSSGLLHRDSKKVKGGLNHRFERPVSNVSLPPEDSIHSSMSGGSDHHLFRVSALDMFSPRPTIRCSVGSQYYYDEMGTSPVSNKSSKATPRKRGTSIIREDVGNKRSSRIDDLADSLDAGALREIMERDQRRREKKRRADDERLRRRLERRAEKQRLADAAGESPTTPRKQGRKDVGLGIEREATPTPMEDIRPSTPQHSQPQIPAQPPQPTYENNQLPTPTQSPTKTAQTNQTYTPLESPVEEPVVSNAQQAIRYSRGSVAGPGHLRGSSNVSHLPELLSERMAGDTPIPSVEHSFDPKASGSLHVVDTADSTVNTPKGTPSRRSSERRRSGYFTSFFKWGKRRSQDPNRATPSEASFSNTSRESMSRQPLPAHLVAPPPSAPIQIKRPANVPRRTMSKFREDLPEFPMSPPDSRVQSPEVATGALAGRRRSRRPAELRVESDSPGLGARTDSPISPGVANAGLMSQSLASVDSEGSWLSGRPVQRMSNKSYLRSSIGSSSALKRTEGFNASYEELGIPDDEYVNKHTTRAAERGQSALRMQDDAAESDDEVEPAVAVPPVQEDEEEHVKSGVGRQPTIIYRQARVKSTEGLLSFYDHSNDILGEPAANASAPQIVEGDSPTSDGELMLVQRAKSVDLGKHHMRHLSAGSAKLLDIKRSSQLSQNKAQ